MRLYHGTYNENLIEILKCGYLDNTKAFKDTLRADKLIEKYLGKKLTNDALYLTDDIYSTHDFDYDFKLIVDVDLDREKLFVAEHTYRDILINFEDDCKEGVDAMKNYIKSFVSYNEYISKHLNYECPEFLYFDTVDIEHLDEEIFNHLEETGEFEEELKVFL